MNRKKLTGSTALRKVVGCVALYGIIKLFNFAHCDVYMIGAYVG